MKKFLVILFIVGALLVMTFAITSACENPPPTCSRGDVMVGTPVWDIVGSHQGKCETIIDVPAVAGYWTDGECETVTDVEGYQPDGYWDKKSKIQETGDNWVCPRYGYMYTSYDSNLPCSKGFGYGRGKYTKYADMVNKPTTKWVCPDGYEQYYCSCYKWIVPEYVEPVTHQECDDPYWTDGTPAVTHEECETINDYDWTGYTCVIPEPTVEPTPEPTLEPTPEPTLVPILEPTIVPTLEPTVEPTLEPTLEPTPEPACTKRQYVLRDEKGHICYLRINYFRGNTPNVLPGYYRDTPLMVDLCSSTCTGRELPYTFGKIADVWSTCQTCDGECE